MVMKLAMLVAVILIVFTFYKRMDKKKEEAAEREKAEEQKKAQLALEMKQDPICNSFVEETTKHKVKLYDDIYYFCSEDCKNKFIDKHKNG